MTFVSPGDAGGFNDLSLAEKNGSMTDVQVLNPLDVPWSAGLVLVALGAVLMVFGGLWRDFTEALLASLLGGMAALLLMPATAINPLWAVVGVCLAIGVLTVLFRRVALVVLTAAMFGAALSLMGNLLAGWPTARYMVHSLSHEGVGVFIDMPDFTGSQLLLGLLLGGMLLGVIVAIVSAEWARRVVMAAGGSLAFLIGVTLLASAFFSGVLSRGYPLRYPQAASVVWAELGVVSVLMQRMVDRRAPPGRSADAEPTRGEDRS